MQEEPTSSYGGNARPSRRGPLQEAVDISFEASAIAALVSRDLWQLGETEIAIDGDHLTLCARALDGMSRLLLKASILVEEAGGSGL